MKIIMLGAPGAGKGTQAQNIAEKYQIPHISTGDLFRANLKAGTELGKEARKYMNDGMLVPDEVTIGMLMKRLEEADCSKGYILDGFPRNIPQAESLAAVLKKAGERIDYAINIEVPDEYIIKRMSGRRACPGCGATYHLLHKPPKKEGCCDVCGKTLVLREDDETDTVKKRLEVYHDQTQPLISYYKKAGILKETDGTCSMDKVFEDIINILEEK